MIQRFFVSAAMLLCLAVDVRANDWPQFRGPLRDGISQEKGLLKAWPEKGPRLEWTFKNGGLGFSSMAVVGNVIYFSGTRGDDEVVIALDADKGTEKWTAKIGPIFTFAGNTWGDGPRGTPTIDGDFLYALGGQGELICVDRTKNGKEIWRTSLIGKLGGKMMSQWGFSESPLVDGNLLICTPGGPNGTLAALDKKTGAVQWRSKELQNDAPYSSVMAAEFHGVRQYIVNSFDDGKGFTSGVAAKDGKLLWSMQIFDAPCFAIGPNPIIKDNLVYVTVGSDGNCCHLFEIGKDMKATDKYPTKFQKKVKNAHGGVVLIGDYIYGHSDKETWICQHFMTGKIAWDERNQLTTVSGAVVAAEGKLYALTEEGKAALMDADPKGFDVISEFTLPELSNFKKIRNANKAARVWSHPVIANGRLLLRDCEFVYCYDIREKK